ncbi:hypothetical protein Q0812_11790 [Brevundimonas sp. 2R-24]|uniref:Uncharacterized protein n=1 Tax=Peiella sedimenti TaxID=3061083 RepID=A0ABT8SQS1_9CAUL|nr:hypothetical protein [Caulobacteraceae bacterium XZ-24]
MAQMYAMVGDEAAALTISAQIETASLERRRASGSTLAAEAAPDLTQTRSAPAAEYILRQAEGRRLVILNEAHHLSRCRAFAEELLSGLASLGFTWFAAETFQESANAWSPGQAVRPDMGFYVRDPVYAELVRKAGRLGFSLAAYEMRQDQVLTTDSPSSLELLNHREAMQASNLVAHVFERDPGAKVFCLCGYGHAVDNPRNPELARMFAARLRELTGIDPLTISQTGGQPARTPMDDSPAVHAVLERFEPVDPIVVLDALGGTVRGGRSDNGMDLAVFHPRYEDVYGRPGWLAKASGRVPVRIALPPDPSGSERLLQALHASEGSPTVPADQCPVAGMSAATLFLRPGRYRLRVETEGGIIWLEDIGV